MDKAEIIFSELTKVARLTGAQPANYGITNPELPYSIRMDALREFYNDKSQELKSKWSTVLPVGALGGAVFGTAVSGFKSPTVLAVGAGLGALLAAALKKKDDDEIYESKTFMANAISNNSDLEGFLRKRIVRRDKNLERQRTIQRLRDENKHQELINAIKAQ